MSPSTSSTSRSATASARSARPAVNRTLHGYRPTLLDAFRDRGDELVGHGRSNAGPILAVPYPQEVNDIPAIAVRRGAASDFADMIVDQFDEMLHQSTESPMVMGIALHAYIVGQPFRLKHPRRALAHITAAAPDRVWLIAPGAIADHVEALPSGTAPGS